MKAVIKIETEQKTYSMSRFSNRVQETVYTVYFNNGFKASFCDFVRTLYNHSKNPNFKNDCDKIRKSKSLKKKQDFLNQNLQSYIELIGKDFGVFLNGAVSNVCTCLNWHPAIENNKGKKAICSYCKRPRR